MKKAMIVLGVLCLLAVGGAWWFMRGSTAAVSLDEASTGFSATNQGAGRLLRFQDGGTPLRIFQWLKPVSGGAVVAQVLTQTDRQQIALFQNGQLMSQMHVARPDGVSDGFYRFAQLRDAVIVPGDVAVLLYRAQDATSADMPVILALDLKTQGIRWCHRAVAEHLSLGGTPGKPDDSVVFAYSVQGDVVRLPLALQKGEREGAKPPRAAAVAIELSPEIDSVTGFIATSHSTFIISHRKGLSAFLGEKGWNNISNPAPSDLGFVEPKSSLAIAGHTIWWQPEPGQLIGVKPDGTPVAKWSSTTFNIPAASAKDAELLQLLGADPTGKLWFGLAAPTLAFSAPLPQPPTPTPTPTTSSSTAVSPATDTGWKAEGHATTTAPVNDSTTRAPAQALDRSAWEAYLRLGLDRLYCWDPASGAVRRVSWTECWRNLGPPSDFSIPMGDGDLHPAAGGFLFGSGTQAWWLPLDALTLNQVSTSAKAGPAPILEPLVMQAPPTPSVSDLPGSTTPKS